MRRTQGRMLRALLIFLMILLVMSMILQYVTKRYLAEKTLDQLTHSSTVIASLASAYYADGGMTNMQFIINMNLATEVSGYDILLCDATGQVVLCSYSPTGCYHQKYHLSQEYMDKIIANEGDRDTCILTNLYEDVRHVAAVPVYSTTTGEVVGVVLSSTPMSPTAQVTTQVSNFYQMAIILLMLVGCAVTLYVSRKKDSPLREMAKTARSFGHGDLNVRVMLEGKQPEEIEELALAFNNMASSLQKSEYSRQEFVANVSHELKTPMTTIGGYIDGILDGTIPENKQRYYMQIVSDETKRLSRLVRSMLDISQLQGEGGIPADKLSRFDAEECVGQMLITFEQKIMKKDINVEVEMPDYPVYTIANRDYISQVIYNLLDNAVKFCPDGGTLWVTVQEGDNKLYISIANQGPTIPPEELSLLFDRFHKIDKSRSENRDGWGLGLYIVKTIIGLHGENISVTSIDGKTEFTFTLPLEN